MNTSTPDTNNTQQQRAFVIIIVFLVAILANFILSISLGVRTGAWQQFARAVIVLLFGIATILAATRIKRGQVESGIWLLIGGLMFTLIGTALLLAGLGLMLAIILLVLVSIVAALILPIEKRRKAFLLALGAAVLIFGLNFLPLNYRIPAPTEVSAALPIIAVAVVLVVGGYIARQAWDGNIRLKIVTAFTVGALTSLGILGTVTYINYRDQVREDFRQRLANMVGIIALQQDADLLATIQSPGNEETDAYQEVRAINSAIIQTEPELVYIYTMRKNEQGQLYFVVDTGQPGDEDTAAVAEIYEDPTPWMFETFDSNTINVDEDFYTDKWGTFLSAFAPIYADDGRLEGIVGIDIAAETIVKQEQKVLFLILGTIAVTLFLVTLLSLWLGTLLTKPIISLSLVAQQVTEGNLSARAEVETADEVGDLANSFNIMTTQLQETLEGLEKRVDARTKDLATVADISTTTATIRDPLQMLANMVQLTQRGFGLYHAHVFTYDKITEELGIVACGWEECTSSKVSDSF